MEPRSIESSYCQSIVSISISCPELPAFLGVGEPSIATRRIACDELDQLPEVKLLRPKQGHAAKKCEKLNADYQLTVARIASLYRAVAGGVQSGRDAASIQTLRSDLSTLKSDLP